MHRLLYISLLTILVSSCAITTYTVDVEVLKPSRTNLQLENNDRIMLVSSYRPSYRYTQDNSTAYLEDSMLVASIAQNLISFYQNVGCYSQNYVQAKYVRTDEKEPEELTQEQLKGLALLEQPKYIINMPLFRMLIKKVGTYTYKVNCITLWRVYDNSDSCRLISEHVSKDTSVYFQNEVAQRETIDSAIAMNMTGEIATKMGYYFFPNWIQESRYFILTTDIEFYKVRALIEAFKWNEVIELMQPYVSSSNQRDVYAASFNIALACEMKGQFDLAEKWLQKAQSVKSTYATKQYEEKLKERKKSASFLPY